MPTSNGASSQVVGVLGWSPGEVTGGHPDGEVVGDPVDAGFGGAVVFAAGGVAADGFVAAFVQDGDGDEPGRVVFVGLDDDEGGSGSWADPCFKELWLDGTSRCWSTSRECQAQSRSGTAGPLSPAGSERQLTAPALSWLRRQAAPHSVSTRSGTCCSCCSGRRARCTCSRCRCRRGTSRFRGSPGGSRCRPTFLPTARSS